MTNNVKLPAQGIGDTTPIVSTVQLADGSQVENIQLGTVAGGIFTPTQLALDATLAQILAATLNPLVAPAAAVNNVPASIASGTLQPANPLRKGLVIVNDSTSILYVKFGSAASPTSWTYLLSGSQGGIPATFEMTGVIHTGLVAGVWASATGFARVTELT